MFSVESFSKTTKGVWWWRGADVANVENANKRLGFLVEHGVSEIYLCVDLKKYGKETRSFVKEAGETGEGSLVTFFEEGASAMDVELAKVVSTLQKAKIPLGAGIAIHHLGSWEKLIKKEKSK